MTVQVQPGGRNDMLSRDVDAVLVDVPDFPVVGVLFKDLTPLFGDADLCRRLVGDIATRHTGGVDVIAGIEARGFIFGALVAHELGLPFVPIRKQGKLPRATYAAAYDLEYGTATVEMHCDAVLRGQRVLLIDDVLATGGTAAAAVGLVKQAEAVVTALEVLVEIEALAGRAAIPDCEVVALLTC